MQIKARIGNTPHFVAFSACVSFYLVLLGPIDVFLSNTGEFSSTLAEMISLLSLMSAITFIVILVTLFLIPGTARNGFVRCLAFIVVGSWVLSNFIYGDYGKLDGEQLVIDKWSFLAIVQTVVLLTIFFLALKLQIKKLLNITIIVFSISLLSGTVSAISQEKKINKPWASGFHSQLTQFSQGKNVLHVVLDALQTDLFRRAIESDNKLKEAFDGFTFFSDTLSVFPATEMSISAMMTGEVFRNEMTKREFLDAMREQNEGIMLLETLGYEFDSHTVCERNIVERCTRIKARILDKDATYSEALQLLDIYIFKSVPDYIKPVIYNQEQWRLLGMFSDDNYLKFQSGVGHLLFKQFVETITVGDTDIPHYIFFHSLVTHSPANLDAECIIVDKDLRSSLSRVEFVKCGIGHFAALLEKLKKLGVYDETMIILSADHGARWVGDNVNANSFQNRGINMAMLSRASATLAIKPFSSRGAITETQAPVSLRDIPQTILAAHGLAQSTSTPEPAEVRDVFSVSPTENREREFLFFEVKQGNWREKLLPPMASIRITGKITDPLSWPILEPAIPPGN